MRAAAALSNGPEPSSGHATHPAPAHPPSRPHCQIVINRMLQQDPQARPSVPELIQLPQLQARAALPAGLAAAGAHASAARRRPCRRRRCWKPSQPPCGSSPAPAHGSNPVPAPPPVPQKRLHLMPAELEEHASMGSLSLDCCEVGGCWRQGTCAVQGRWSARGRARRPLPLLVPPPATAASTPAGRAGAAGHRGARGSSGAQPAAASLQARPAARRRVVRLSPARAGRRRPPLPPPLPSHAGPLPTCIIFYLQVLL